MGDIIYNQTLSIVSGKSCNNNNTMMSEKDFELYPAEVLNLTDYNENLATRFSIPPNTTGLVLSTGTIAQIRVLVVKAANDLQLQLVNTNGTSQNITFLANRTSVIHGLLTGIIATNTTSSPIKGLIYVAGD